MVEEDISFIRIVCVKSREQMEQLMVLLYL